MKEIFLMAHLKTSCQRNYLQNFFHSSQIVSENFPLCLGPPGAAGGANCPLHQATANVKVSFGFSIRLVFINFFAFFRVFFGDLGF